MRVMIQCPVLTFRCCCCSLNGGMETLDHLVEAINQQNHTPSASKPDIVSAYSKDEMENIATLLTELKTGFTQ